MTCSNCCGHNDHRSCVDYIPCFGPAGPAGPTATNQFLSLAAGVGTAKLPTAQTSINFATITAANGTDISATVPTSTITLAPNHSYFISYNINTTASGAGTLGGVLVLNGTNLASSAANTSTTAAGSASVSGRAIVTVGPTGPLPLQLATTTSASVFTLANAGISVIELL
ncbi:hypothetical protein [Paraclostridium bifermentans]|uniref:hypothetical protein n=1 Tax=Paraclostridium bifermentans TaxID=1490 RepID=UPI001FF4612B|nr:hypothetical protein [Paraclostridium bifermentans]UOW69668.1 hypothetical protein MTR78_17350 [Paraclostridium bifermentans]